MTENHRLFLESVFHVDHYLYGRKLRPLSLFHYSLLEHFSNPLVVGGEVTADSLRQAGLICSSRDFQEFKHHSASFRNYFLFLYNDKAEYQRWVDYWDDYASFPELLESGNNSKESPFPPSLTFATQLIRNTGWSWDQVFYDLPIGLIIWLNATSAFCEHGETNVLGEKDRWAIAALTTPR